jgi:hypothetical protein
MVMAIAVDERALIEVGSQRDIGVSVCGAKEGPGRPIEIGKIV